MKPLLIIPLITALTSVANSAVMTLDMTTTTGNTAPTLDAGATLDTGSAYTFSGVTLTTSATSNFGDNTAVFNATGSNAGVNTGAANSAAGDESSFIDSGETLTLTFTFGSDVTEFTILNIDFGGIGDATDSATVDYPDGLGGTTNVILTDNEINGDDVWTPTSGITFQNGDQITFSNTSTGGAGSYRIQAIEVDVVVVPEPSSTALLGLGGLALILRRRK